MSKVSNKTVTFLPLALCAIACVAQQSAPKQGASPSSPQAASSSAGGIKFVKGDWLKSPPQFADDANGAHTVILCYSLQVTGGISQPYNFRRLSFLRDSDKNVVNCSPEDDSRPTVQDSRIVFAFDARHVSVGRITDITLSLTSAQGTLLTPVGLRPSVGAGVSTTNLADGDPKQIYYVYWPNRIAGDVLPTATITATYTPPVAGQPWEAETYYAPGSIVIAKAIPDGHFYTTMVGGTSRGKEPSWQHTAAYAEGSSITSCQWQAVNSSLPPTAFPQAPHLWAPNTPYDPWTYVLSPTNSGVYVALRKCTSGNAIPSFNLVPASSKEVDLNSDGKVPTGSAELTDTGRDSLPCTSPTLLVWKPNLAVTTGMTLCDDKDNNRQYKVSTAGTTGPIRPTFIHMNAVIIDTRVPLWFDQGMVQPALVTSAVPSESLVTPLNGVPYPQTHSLSAYNLASGVIVSTIRTPSFAFSTASTTNNGTPVQTGSTLLVDPVIFLSRYLKNFDSESRERRGDFLASTSINLGFSLSSPTNNFYLGGSNEFIRYVQFNYGFALARVPKLAADTFVLSSATTPNTVQVFKEGAYFGVSFNISGLIQGLTSSGSASGAAKSGSATSGH